MNRAAVLTAATGLCAMSLGGPTAVSSAEPPATYQFATCYDPAQPVQERPATVVYGCDHTSVMENMTWTAWGPDGATGTGIDNAVECQPNCAEGRRLSNPIVVHAWNPAPADTPGCPAGAQFYRDFTVAYPEAVPPWVQPGTAWTEDVSYVYVDGMPAAHFTNQSPYSCLAPAY